MPSRPQAFIHALLSAAMAMLLGACNSTDPERPRILEFELKKAADRQADDFNVIIYSVPPGDEPLKVYQEVERLDSAHLSLTLDGEIPARFEAYVLGFREKRIHFVKQVEVDGNSLVSAVNVPLDSLPDGLLTGPQINFSTASGSGEEGEAILATVSLQAASIREITVRLVTEDGPAPGSATAGADYAPMDTLLVFSPGQFSKPISVPVHDDSLNEVDERLRLALRDPVNGQVGLIGALTYTVLDNDPVPEGVLCVDSASAPGGDGRSWGNAFPMLQEALEAAVSGQEIWVAQGIYVPGTERTSSFVLKSGVALLGGFAGGETRRSDRDPARRLAVLSGEIGFPGPEDNIHHVVTAWQAEDAVLDGLVIEDGNAEGAPQIEGITGFPRATGGGVYAAGTGLTLRHCILRRNRAVSGGGLATDGAAVVGCVFEGNVSTTYGGAVSGSRWRIFNSVFSRNAADRGGALHLQRHGNTWDSAAIVFSTLSENLARSAGGALYAEANAPLDIRASALWSNYAGVGTQIYFDGNHSQVEAYESLVQDRYGSGSINSEGIANVRWQAGMVDLELGAKPGFLDQDEPAGADGLWRTEDDGLQLGPGSPLLDTVSLAAPAETDGSDILGAARLKGGKSDIGAYER